MERDAYCTALIQLISDLTCLRDVYFLTIYQLIWLSDTAVAALTLIGNRRKTLPSAEAARHHLQTEQFHHYFISHCLNNF